MSGSGDECEQDLSLGNVDVGTELSMRFDHLEFLDQPPEDHLCGICHNAATEPVVTEECGHLFCRECIAQWMRHKCECPVDRLPIRSESIRRDLRAQRKILSLRVSCTNHLGGCTWLGELNDLERHLKDCELSPVTCPFAIHGCTVVVKSKEIDSHLKESMQDHMLLLSSACKAMKEENENIKRANSSLQRLLALSCNADYFVWAIASFCTKSGAEVSRVFKIRGLSWYFKVGFSESDRFCAVYLYACGHAKRVQFEFILFNHLDPDKDKRLTITDWGPDFKGKGWGNKQFIDRCQLVPGSGFLGMDGTVTLGVHILGEPF